jgi:hypothetical protein
MRSSGLSASQAILVNLYSEMLHLAETMLENWRVEVDGTVDRSVSSSMQGVGRRRTKMRREPEQVTTRAPSVEIEPIPFHVLVASGSVAWEQFLMGSAG